MSGVDKSVKGVKGASPHAWRPWGWSPGFSRLSSPAKAGTPTRLAKAIKAINGSRLRPLSDFPFSPPVAKAVRARAPARGPGAAPRWRSDSDGQRAEGSKSDHSFDPCPKTPLCDYRDL